MKLHTRIYLTSIIVAIAVMLSPDAGICLEIMEADVESEQIGCVRPGCGKAEISLFENSTFAEKPAYNGCHFCPVSIWHKPCASMRGFNVLYCVFRE